MSAEPIDFGTAPTVPPPEGWTVADVDALPDRDGVRYELVDGVPTVMTPARGRHQTASRRLANSLETTAPPDFAIFESVGVVLAPDQRPIPDVVVLRGTSLDTELFNFPADLVVLAAEVVSPSTRSDDRFRKPALYAQAGIPCYLRVELDPPHVVAYRLGPDGVYVEAGRAEPGRTLTLTEPFPTAIDPAALVR
jgi:Uma2 family endonuclease